VALNIGCPPTISARYAHFASWHAGASKELMFILQSFDPEVFTQKFHLALNFQQV
jgi:hypothetical protein